MDVGVIALGSAGDSLDDWGPHVEDREAWTALPEQPRRYRLRDRWSDLWGGRANARAGIPRLESASGVPPLPEDAATTPPVTPYLDGLRNARNLDLAGERGRYEVDRVQLRKEIFEAEDCRELLAIAMQLDATPWDEVSGPLTDQELNRRGLAEQDQKKWPPEMLRERRKHARGLARFQPEEALWKATAEFRVTELAVEYATRISCAGVWGVVANPKGGYWGGG